jgi:hypothetical protein
MISHERELYRSSNGDRWSLIRNHAGRVLVRHQANAASGGHETQLEIGDFLADGELGPEHRELVKLIGTLVYDRPEPQGTFGHHREPDPSRQEPRSVRGASPWRR